MKSLHTILDKFYNFVMDEHDGNLHEFQIYDFIEKYGKEFDGETITPTDEPTETVEEGFCVFCKLPYHSDDDNVKVCQHPWNAKNIFQRDIEKKSNWIFERQSGFAGYRCLTCGTWVYNHQEQICECNK